MAFNPFTSFQKNKKFWMAFVLLLCMITFVLCTGVGGDLSQRLLDMVRGGGGKTLAKIDGRSISDRELHQLKEERQVADRFMKKACEILLKHVEDFINNRAKQLDEKERKGLLTQASYIRADITARLARKHYFETGTTLDDLVNHLMWRNEADRLGVHLVDQAVARMYQDEIFARAAQFFNVEDVSNAIFYDVRGSMRSLTWGDLMNALRDEFRVRIAKLAVAQAQVQSYVERNQPGSEVMKFQEVSGPVSARLAPSPYDLWDAYRKNLQQYEIALVPVSAKDYYPALSFLGKLFPVPSDKELKELFDERKNEIYDPTSPKNGLQVPHKLKVEYILGNPQADYYQALGKTVVALQQLTPVLNVNGSWVSPVATIGASKGAMDRFLERDYHNVREKDPQYTYVRSLKELELLRMKADAPDGEKKVREIFFHVPEGDIAWSLFWQLDKKNRHASAAAWASGLAADPTGMLAVGMFAHRLGTTNKEYEAVIREERQSRALLQASLAGGFAAPVSLWPAVPMRLVTEFFDWRRVSLQTPLQPYLPLAQVREEFYKKKVNVFALEAVQANMMRVRRELEDIKEDPRNQGDLVRRAVGRLVAEYHLEHGGTRDFHDRFSIDGSQGLKELKDAYLKEYQKINIMEGRVKGEGTELRDDQFHRLFFENEKFSVGIGNYLVKPWPPDVLVKKTLRASPQEEKPAFREGEVINLFQHAEKPILFYKTAETQAVFPTEMTPEIKERALEIWKLERARDLIALNEARRIADLLHKTADENLDAAAVAEAAKIGRKRIQAKDADVGTDFARLVAHPREVTGYFPFKLFKDAFDYPREDMVVHLQALADGKEPVKLAGQPPFAVDSALDKHNKDLFDENVRLGKDADVKRVQILANKPRSTFYVAVIVRKPPVLEADFFKSYRHGVATQFRAASDEFLARTQADLGKQFLQDLTGRLRDLRNVSIDATDDDRKSFRE